MRIELNLLDNGLDFITEGLKPTNKLWNKGDSKNVWKYSVLNVFSGIQLILKDRLRQEHWSLIFEDVSNAKEEKLNQGDFISVNHKNVIKRLNGIANINLDDEPINELRKLRNRFEHFQVMIEVEECKQSIAKAIRVLIIFWNENISNYSNEIQNQKFQWIKSISAEFDTYALDMLQKNASKINGIIKGKSGILAHCKHCTNFSFMIYKDDKRGCECYVCELKIDKRDFLKQIRNKELENSQSNSLFKHEEYKTTCETCEYNSRIRYRPSYFLTTEKHQSDYFLCTNCLHKETQSEINSNKLHQELLELEKKHSPEEYIKILESMIIDTEEE